MPAHNLTASLVLPATFTVPGIARSHLTPSFHVLPTDGIVRKGLKKKCPHPQPQVNFQRQVLFLNPHEVMKVYIPRIPCPCTLLGNIHPCFIPDWTGLHLFLKKRKKREMREGLKNSPSLSEGQGSCSCIWCALYLLKSKCSA